MKYAKIFLLLIILVGGFLRFYMLAEIPNGVYVDEAAIGYNAFSILKTGLDEYGRAFPVLLRSFNSFSSPLYVYLSVLPIKVFGLSAFSVRFLSAFLGTLSIPLIYMVLAKLFNNKNKPPCLVGTFLFAISPWHIFFSRGAFEANLALFLLLVAVYFLLLVKKGEKYYLISSAILAIATYSYHSQRLISPLILIIFGILFYKQKKLSIKIILLSLVVFTVLLLPQIIISGTPGFGARAAGLFYTDAILAQTRLSFLPKFVALPLSFFREFMAQFIAYFSPKNLFLLGDSDLQRSIPELPPFYSWIAVFYFTGFFALFKKVKKGSSLIILIMLFVFAAPAAIAKDPFSSLRALSLIITFISIITLGVDFLSKKFGQVKIISLTLVLSLISILFLWRGYFVLLPNERATTWNYGYKELSQIIKTSEEFFVVDTSRVKPPHILLAFHMQIPPEEYQKVAAKKIINDYYENLEFDSYYNLLNFETRSINWEEDIYKERILVGDALAISESQIEEHKLERVFEIYDPLDNLVFQGVRTNPEEKCESVGNKNQQCVY